MTSFYRLFFTLLLCVLLTAAGVLMAAEPASSEALDTASSEVSEAQTPPSADVESDALDQPQGLWIISVKMHDKSKDLRTLRSLHMDVAGTDRKRNVIDVLGTAEDYERMESAGLDVEYESPISSDPGVDALSDYLNPTEVAAFLDQMVATYPSIAQKVQYATSVEGRPVWAMKISDNVAQEEDEPVIMFVAQHHAREVMTPEIATDIIEQLLTQYGTDPDLTRYVDEREIWVLPNHNPDGASYVFTDNSNWRKNRRDNGDGSIGVDPNRNYAFKWGSCDGSDGFGSSDTYRGPSPASEPITGPGIQTLATEQRPWINLSYHTYSEIVIHPYGCEGSYSSENAVFRDFASQVGTRIEGDNPNTWYGPGTAPELLYAVDGEMNDWFYGEIGSYGVTIEANTSVQGFRPDYDTWRDSTVERNRPGWQYLLERADGSGISGNITDACTGSPLVAETNLASVVFSNGEAPRESEPTFGRYYWMTLPGDYEITASLAGYESQTLPVKVDHERVEQDFNLVPNGSFGATSVRWIIDDTATGDGDGQADPGETFNLSIELLNTGGALTGLTGTLSTTTPNVSILDNTSTYGSLAAGQLGTGDGYEVSVGSAITDETMLNFTLNLSADQSLCGSTLENTMRATIGASVCPSITEPFDADPSWTINNSGSGGWNFGEPAGDGGSAGPNTAYTGDYVYGTNLSGSYGANGNFTLTTPVYDLRGLRNSTLKFAEWLDNESGFDRGRVDISLDSGATWTEVWSGFDYGDGWKMRTIDVSEFADQEQTVQFRFNLMSDSGTQASGWAIDDFSLCGEEIPNAAGKLSYDRHTVDDSDLVGGNGNGSVDEGETVTLDIRIRSNRDSESTGVEAFLTTTHTGVRIRNGYAQFPNVPVGGNADVLDPGFSFELTDASCADRIPFQLDIRWDGGSATSSFSVPIGDPVLAIVMDDDLETDLGWTVGGDATAGDWVLVDPNGVVDDNGNPVQPEDDTTVSGVQAWVTGNPKTSGNFNPGDGDVDGGTTWIESPVFDGTNADRLTLSYQRWFTRRFTNTFDQSNFSLEVSNDDGVSWLEAETTSVDNAVWAPIQIDLTDTIAGSNTMRLRFSATENVFSGDPLIEAAIDDLSIERERLECSPFTAPSQLAPNPVGNSLLVDRSGSHLRLDWANPPVDGSHDAASGFMLYQSNSPEAGFSITRWPGANFEVLMDEMIQPSTQYYLIVAENEGGTSGDEPAP